MNSELMSMVLHNVKKVTPLVHCITNYVTVNDVANIVLACGGSPIMADDIHEAADISRLCTATCINIGTLNERTIASMVVAGYAAHEAGHITLLDPVGAGASAYRTDTAIMLMKKIPFSVIRGNMSEIKALASAYGVTVNSRADTAEKDIGVKTQGVDVNASDKVTDVTVKQSVALAQKLAEKTHAVIAVSGAIDIIADDSHAYICRNGCAEMSRITGTGCMLSALTTVFCAANKNTILHTDAVLSAAVVSFAVMGLCGERAQKKSAEAQEGTGSFRSYLIDEMSTMTAEKLIEGQKIEEFRP
jgi:hydroxyethylthiazole kinase